MAEQAPAQQAASSRPKAEWIKRKSSGRERAYATTGLVMTMHFLLKCSAGGHWHWITPDDALIDFYACILVVPLSLVWDMFINRLERASGNEGEG